MGRGGGGAGGGGGLIVVSVCGGRLLETLSAYVHRDRWEGRQSVGERDREDRGDVTAVPVIALLVTAGLVLTAAVTVVLELVPMVLALLCQAGAFYEA